MALLNKLSPANRRHLRDAMRIATTIGLAVFLLFGDAGTGVILAAVGIMVGTVGLTHLLRRIMFPYVDPKELIQAAIKDKNIPAAMVFAAICMVICTWSFMLISLLK